MDRMENVWVALYLALYGIVWIAVDVYADEAIGSLVAGVTVSVLICVQGLLGELFGEATD